MKKKEAPKVKKTLEKYKVNLSVISIYVYRGIEVRAESEEAAADKAANWVVKNRDKAEAFEDVEEFSLDSEIQSVTLVPKKGDKS